MIQAIIFDCFGVLYRDRTSALYDYVPREYHDGLHDAIRSADFGYITRDALLTKAAELAGISANELRAKLSQTQLVRDELLATQLSELRSRYKLGLLSNISGDVINELFSPTEREAWFDVVTQSSDEGIIKPNPEIFERCALRLGVPAENCLMVDDMADNIRGAQAAGMQAVLFENVPQFRADLAVLEARYA